MFYSDADVFPSASDYFFVDVGFVDFVVVEAVFLLEDIAEGLTWVVEVAEAVGESEFISHAVRR